MLPVPRFYDFGVQLAIINPCNFQMIFPEAVEGSRDRHAEDQVMDWPSEDSADEDYHPIRVEQAEERVADRNRRNGGAKEGAESESEPDSDTKSGSGSGSGSGAESGNETSTSDSQGSGPVPGLRSSGNGDSGGRGGDGDGVGRRMGLRSQGGVGVEGEEGLPLDWHEAVEEVEEVGEEGLVVQGKRKRTPVDYRKLNEVPNTCGGAGGSTHPPTWLGGWECGWNEYGFWVQCGGNGVCVFERRERVLGTLSANQQKTRSKEEVGSRILNKPIISYRRYSVSWTRVGVGRPACSTGVPRNPPGRRGTEEGQKRHVSLSNPTPFPTPLPPHVIPLCWRSLLNPGVAGGDRVGAELPSPAQPRMGRLGI